MAHPWILQRYIFRELRNNFVLTAAALTVILSLGGGIVQMLKVGEVTPGQFFRLMLLIVPVAAALTLPLAALFSTAVTYGRLSADNELVACRGSGINLHVLMLPTVGLSLVSASLTFGFANYLIPGLIRNVNEFVGSDIGALIERRLKSRRVISLGGRYRIHADEFAFDPAEPSRVTFQRVAFVEEDRGERVRFGTGREIEMNIQRDEKMIRASGVMRALCVYDRRDGRFIDSSEQIIPESEVAPTLPRNIKFLTLGELLHYRSHPEEWGTVRDAVAKLRLSQTQVAALEALLKSWRTDGRITLGDAPRRMVLKADSARTNPRSGAIDLTGIILEESGQEKPRIVRATRGQLGVETAPDRLTTAHLELFDVRTSERPQIDVLPRTSIGPLPLELATAVPPIRDEALVSTPDGPNDFEMLVNRRMEARRVWADTARHILGTIHERAAFSISVFVLVILAAALGTIFRGAHVLTAFGISFLPMLLVLITIISGRQMARHEASHGLGIALIWSGILFVALFDGWIVTRVLRR